MCCALQTLMNVPATEGPYVGTHWALCKLKSRPVLQKELLLCAYML